MVLPRPEMATGGRCSELAVNSGRYSSVTLKYREMAYSFSSSDYEIAINFILKKTMPFILFTVVYMIYCLARFWSDDTYEMTFI